MGHVSVTISSRSGLKFLRLASGLEPEAEQAERDIGERGEIIFSAHALKDTSRMARSIKWHRTGPGVIEIQSDARDPSTGYRYTGVTRKGHRKLYITAKPRSRASVISTRKMRAHGKKAALRIVIDGKVMFRRRVRGFKPPSDWVQDAMPSMKAATKQVVGHLGTRIMRRFT